MAGIRLDVLCHHLNTNPKKNPIRQKRRAMDLERYNSLKEELDKLLNIDFIREVHHPIWLANLVLVKKPNGKWRTCMDYNDLNKACPKDNFLLPRID